MPFGQYLVAWEKMCLERSFRNDEVTKGKRKDIPAVT
jgi:hypothetical protein